MELRLVLEQLLADYFRRRRAIVELRRRLSPYTSTFRIEEIDVTFADGFKLPIVMKDLSRPAMRKRCQQRAEFLYDPLREIETYRRILPHAPAGPPIGYGHTANPEADDYKIFLERIDGLELRDAARFSTWEATAQWIARFHQSFAGGIERLAHSAKLLVYDESFYWCWLERARQFAARRPTIRRVLDRIAGGYALVVSRLVALPRTLIHGDFYPSNVLVQGNDHVRICPIDWEMAAIGPGLIDLASLATGWSERGQRALIRAYRARAGEHRNKVPRVTRDFLRDLDCCRLHLAVRMLGWSAAWAPPAHHARDWLAEAESLAERLRE